MKKSLLTGIVTLLLVGSVSEAAPTWTVAQDGDGDGTRTFVSFILGARVIDDLNDLDVGLGEDVDLGNHFALGLEFHTVGESGFGFETGFAYSLGNDDVAGVDVDLYLIELMFGGRYTYPNAGRFMPYVGAGLDVIFATVEADAGGLTVSDDTSDLGVYVRGGANYLLGSNFSLGVDLRGLLGSDEDLDYVQASVVFGWAL